MNYLVIAVGLSTLLLGTRAVAQGSYGRTSDQCTYLDKGKTVYRFDCRVMYGGDIKPSNVIFIDNYKNGDRYYVGDSGQRISDSNTFRYAGGRCIANAKDKRIRVCWR